MSRTTQLTASRLVPRRSVGKRTLSPFLALTLLVAIACSDDDAVGTTPPAPVASVTVSPTTQTLVIGTNTGGV